MKKLLDFNPFTGVRKFFHSDSDGENFAIESVQDVTPVVELTQAEFNAIDERAPWKGDMHKVASIPLNVMGELQRTGIWFDDDALKKWMNDPANRKYRTRPGRV